MSEVEEPPAKLSKIEMSSQNEEAEEEQEEWLSEGILTDDDNVEVDPNKTDSNLDSAQEDLDETFLDETILSGDHSMDSQNMSSSQGDAKQQQETQQENKETKKPATESIEQTLNNLENQSQDATDKQTDSQQTGKSDGNDTDDLLRLLGDNDEKIKKKVLVKTKDKMGMSRGLKEKAQREEDSGSSDDDEFVFNSTVVKKLRVAKNALSKKPASKAEPEDLSDGDDETDCSSDEASTMKNIFDVKKTGNIAVKNTTTTTTTTTKPSYTNQSQPQKKVIKIGNTTIAPSKKPTPNRPTLATKQPPKPAPKQAVLNVNNGPNRIIERTRERTPNKETKEKKPPPPSELDEIIDEQEFMEEDDFDLTEDFAENFDHEISRSVQQIMKPEEMDEEMPTDADSDDSDALYDMYDELPSSDSEDRDDWFSLDIRAERACDYIPLLGDKAIEILNEEKRRVASRVWSLRESVSRLQRSGRQRAQRLRRAAGTLAELDDMLKAA